MLLRGTFRIHSVDFLPAGYAPKGWLGLMLGTRMWYGFFGDVLNNTAAFLAKVDALCRELGVDPFVRASVRVWIRV